MAWKYYCADDDITLSADTQEDLALELMRHVEEDHGENMSYDEALQSVQANAKQKAA
ncbi:MAG TPA: hypothetical protein VHV83_12600 [Armatimonadota bacterium]|nr:hypothetical protein [Armatimonadota bacterium]